MNFSKKQIESMVFEQMESFIKLIEKWSPSIHNTLPAIIIEGQERIG